MQIRAMEQRQEMNEIPKDELEQLCERVLTDDELERIAIEVQDMQPDIAQKAFEFRAKKAKQTAKTP